MKDCKFLRVTGVFKSPKSGVTGKTLHGDFYQTLEEAKNNENGYGSHVNNLPKWILKE